jgi:hypothetical protein
MVVLFPLSIFSSWTGAASTLSKQLPPDSLLKKGILISMLAQALIALSMMLIVFTQIPKMEEPDNYLKCTPNKWDAEEGEDVEINE